MGLGSWMRDAAKSGGIQGLGNKVSGNSGSSPLSQNQLQNAVGMMNNTIQGKNPYSQAKPIPNRPGSNASPTGNPLPPNAAPAMQAPGRNGYTPTTAPYGMDQTNPGVQEQFWNQNQNLWTKGAFQGPGQGEQFWNQVQGSFNANGNNNLQPQFDAAYDRARDKAVGSANAQAAARGVYGSSSALNNVGNVIADVEAARAKESSNFALANAANQRSNLSQYGDLAFNAQNASLANRGFDLSALGSAFNASGAAQSQRDNRIQNQFGNQMAMAGMYLPFLQGNYDQMLGTDLGLVTGAGEAGMAGTASALNQQQNNRQQMSQDISNGLGIYGAYKNANR